MDFDKIKPAVEEIRLSDDQAARILEACKSKKRKKTGKIWIPVAVAAACAVIVFSPTVFIGMKGANSEAQFDSASPVEDYFAVGSDGLYSDSDDEGIYYVQSSSSAASASGTLFECDGFRSIYAIVPTQFSWLVDVEEFNGWKSTVDASGGMAMLQFVEHFGIPREDFDAANDAYAAFIKSNGSDAEIFNADIIYSFDREKIDEHYKAD